MVRLAGLEPATNGFEVRYSIQLSYRRISLLLFVTEKWKNGEKNGQKSYELLFAISRSRLPVLHVILKSFSLVFFSGRISLYKLLQIGKQ